MFVRWFVPLTIPVDLCWGQAGGCTLPVTTYFVEGTASHGNWFVGLPQHIREFRHAPRPRVLVCGFETKSFVGTIRCRCVGVSSVGSQNRYARLIRVLIRSSFGTTSNKQQQVFIVVPSLRNNCQCLNHDVLNSVSCHAKGSLGARTLARARSRFTAQDASMSTKIINQPRTWKRRKNPCTCQKKRAKNGMKELHTDLGVLRRALS